MGYWLVKSEPSVYAWQQLVMDRKTVWDGIRNYAARNHLRSMKKGDKVLFYHSNEGLEIVGIAEVTRESFQDPGTDNPNWVAVEIKPFRVLNKPLSLKLLKSDPILKQMEFVRISRLSVSQVLETEFDRILDLSDTRF